MDADAGAFGVGEAVEDGAVERHEVRQQAVGGELSESLPSVKSSCTECAPEFGRAWAQDAGVECDRR